MLQTVHTVIYRSLLGESDLGSESRDSKGREDRKKRKEGKVEVDKPTEQFENMKAYCFH